MLASISAEVLILRKRAATWILLLIWAVLSAFFGYLLPYMTYRSNGAGPFRAPIDRLLPQHLTENLVGSFPFYGGAIVLILGVLSIGSDFGWGTIKTLFTQRPGRLRVFVSKMVALGLALIPFVLAVYALGAVWGTLIAQAEHLSIGWPDVGQLARGLLAGWFILTVWAGFGAFLAVLSRGTSLAIGVGVVYALAIEAIISAFGAAIPVLHPVVQGLIRANAYSLVKPLAGSVGSAATAGPGIFAGPYVADVQAFVVLAAYLAVFLAIAAALLRRRDVV